MSLFVPLCLCGSSLQSLSISVAAWLRYVLVVEESFFSFRVFPCLSVPFVDKMARTFLSSPRWRIRPMPKQAAYLSLRDTNTALQHVNIALKPIHITSANIIRGGNLMVYPA
uniref:Uncharacterized protein n=1 Tax=Candidatus Kentrum sp. FM TaxID=2126340 RepID=A0A450U3S0_9GAMM|nr:MAG: hypothetical protein BECKFM1743A_GA0114220_110411 [Candidatus Kentron sp. FM]